MTAPTPLVVSPQTVQLITGATVDAAQIAQARSIIELYVGVDLTNLARLAARDRTWTGKAIAYQAAWMQQQPDLFARMDVTSMSQDGLTLALRDKKSLVLSPLARQAISRVSWNRARTVLVAPGREARLANRVDHGYGDAEFDTDADVMPGPLVAGGPVYDYATDGDDGWEPV